VIALVFPILAPLFAVAPAYRIDSVRFRFTHYDQTGLGYQSAAGPAGQPGSERATIEQPQAEVIARIGDRVTQRIWVPLDVITAASPDHSRYGIAVDAAPPDAVTTASRVNVAGSFDALTTYRWDSATDVYFGSGIHLEEPFQSWTFGLGVTRSFAQDNTVVNASVNQLVDWFDRFDLEGGRHGRANRSTSNLNLAMAQVLSAFTIVGLSYGGTLQVGTLGNTWSSVPVSDGTRAEERLPRRRQRHALAVRVAQWLPWQAAFKAGYRVYLDGWGIAAHTVETNLTQRVARWLRLSANYRWHWQSQVSFFTTSAGADDEFRTADSDLDHFVAQTVGGAVLVDLPLPQWSAWGTGLRDLHLDIGFERYFRSTGLTANITTCGVGFRF
jgi:Protein of unknown function (DUF3570)